MISAKTIYYRWGLTGLLPLGTQALFAASQSTHDSTPQNVLSRIAPYVITLSIGPTWGSGGKAQTFYVQPETERTYTADQQTHVLADGELFFGIQRGLNTRIQGQFGLAIATTSNAGLSGDIWDDANPEFNNFTYHYQVRHTHVAVKGKLLQRQRLLTRSGLAYNTR